jgi:4-hydroxy-2-oxoheptanedioate aldolase
MNKDSSQKLKDHLAERACMGIFSKTTDSALVEAAGKAGLDFIILDTEHGPASWETIHHHVRAAKLTGMASIVRVPGVNPHAIAMALDSGAIGVQVPNIATAEEAEIAVKAARFHPKGMRGVCRFVRAAEFGATEKVEYFKAESEKLLVLQVEGVEGVQNIDAILQVEGFDVLFIGPYDLSQSVCKPGEVESPEVIKHIITIANKCTATGKTLGIFCDSERQLERYRKLKMHYLAFSVDLSIYREAISHLTGS